MKSDPSTSVDRIRADLVEFGTSGDPVLLTDALERVETVLAAEGFRALAPAAQALVWLLGASAATLRARTAAGNPADLDSAIDWTDHAVTCLPEGDANLPVGRANLATALADRYDRDGVPADLERALTLFELAVPGLRDLGGRVDIALHGHGQAYYTSARLRGRGGRSDLDRAIVLFDEAVANPDPDDDERAGYLNSLGLALRAKGRANADPSLLFDADTAFRAARRLATPDGDNGTAAAENLAALLADRADAENDAGLLREAIALYRQILPSLTGQPARRAEAGMATALVDIYRYTRDPQLLDEAARRLSECARGIPPGPDRLVAMSNLAATLHELFSHTGFITALDEAIKVQEDLLAPPAPRPAERTLNLGVSLLGRFRRRRRPADLDGAIALFAEAARTTGSGIERASALNSQANALSMRYELHSQVTDLDSALDLRAKAIAAAPAGSVDVALYRANLGVDLLQRFEFGHDPGDLDRAIVEQRRAVAAAPATFAEQPRLLAGLADSLARKSGCPEASPGAQEEVRRTYRKVIDLGLESQPEYALGAARSWGDWEAGRRAWDAAGLAYECGLAATRQLVARQETPTDKQSWLLDSLGLSTAAAFCFGQAAESTRAVVALEQGRALMLAEAIQRREFHGGSKWRQSVDENAADSSDANGGRTSQTHSMTEPGIEAIRAARAELDAVIDEIRQVKGFEQFLAPPTFDDIAVTAHDTPLVYLAAADQGGLALIVRGRDVEPVPLDLLTADKVLDLAGQHLTAYESFLADTTAGRRAWSDWLSGLTRGLWDDVVGPVLATLGGSKEIVLIAGGLLGLLPLHAAWTEDPGYPTGRRHALDETCISYAPNARALAAARELAGRTPRRRLVTVVDPQPSSAPPLAWAPIEADGFAAGAGLHPERLDGPAATRLAFRNLAKRADVLHLACHGKADLGDPMNSRLLLAGRPAPLRELMQMQLEVRLAVLSACETALPGTELPDEVIGLPTGLLQAGVAGVVASQWAVPDRATAMLVTEFARQWAGGALPPAQALRRAQQWLRDTTNAEKRLHWESARTAEPGLPDRVVDAFLDALRFGEPNDRDHADLVAWAAFTHLGA